MSKDDTILIFRASQVAKFARRVRRRVKRTEGQITENGVLADFAGSINDEDSEEKLNWGGIVGRRVFCHHSIKLKDALDAISGPKPPHEPKGLPAEPDFELLVTDETISKETVQEKAKLWHTGGYEGLNDKLVVCRFGGVNIRRHEIVCFADLYFHMMDGVPLRNINSAYRLFHEWVYPESHELQGPNHPELMQVRDLVMDLAQSYPLHPSEQTEVLLKIWTHLKGFSEVRWDNPLHIQLATHLKWVEDS